MKKAVWTSTLVALFVSLSTLSQAQTVRSVTRQGGAIVASKAAKSKATDTPATPVPTVNTSVPIGWLDVGNDQVIAGWSFDFDSPNGTIEVMVTSETNGKTKPVTPLITNFVRSDVNRAYGIEGQHGYGVLTPSSLCNGVTHLIHVYALDAQTDEPTELSGSPRSLTCGTPKPIGTINGQITGEFGQPLTTDDNNVRVSLYHILVTGEAIWINQIVDPGVDADGKYSFTTDVDDEPLVVGEEYEMVVSANDHIYGRRRFKLAVGGNSIAQQLSISPLTIFGNGTPPPIAPINGLLQLPVLVCNNSHAGQFVQFNVVFAGPGKVSEFNQVSSTLFAETPPQGWCYQYTVVFGVDSALPNGYNYCASIKVGPENEEGYSETSTCALKGVKQK